MNIVRDLRKRKGIHQNELADIIGVSCPTVSYWENGKTDPSGENLKKLAEYFDVDEMTILGYDVDPSPRAGKASETEQIIQQLLEKLNMVDSISTTIKTPEARLLAKGVDKMPKEQRDAIVSLMSGLYPAIFTKGSETE